MADRIADVFRVAGDVVPGPWNPATGAYNVQNMSPEQRARVLEQLGPAKILPLVPKPQQTSEVVQGPWSERLREIMRNSGPTQPDPYMPFTPQVIPFPRKQG